MEAGPEIAVGPGSQAKKDATELQDKSKSMKAEIVRAEERAKEAEAVRDKAVTAIGNLVHDSVPVSNDEVGALINHFSYIEHFSYVEQMLPCRDMSHLSTVYSDPCLAGHGQCMRSSCFSTTAAHAWLALEAG